MVRMVRCMISRAGSRTSRSKRSSNFSVLAGVISEVEKRLYRCDDFLNVGEEVSSELEFENAHWDTDAVFAQQQSGIHTPLSLATSPTAPANCRSTAVRATLK